MKKNKSITLFFCFLLIAIFAGRSYAAMTVSHVTAVGHPAGPPPIAPSPVISPAQGPPSPGFIVNPGAFYCQGSTNYNTYGNPNPLQAGSLGQDGCAPTALAIILSGYGDDVDTPDQIARYLTSIGTEGFSNNALGYTNWDFITRSDVQSHYNLDVMPVTIDSRGQLDVDNANFWLQNGYWILGQSDNYHCAGSICAHNFVITAVNSSSYSVKDPQGCAYDTVSASQNNNFTLSRGNFTFLGAFAVKKSQ